MANITEMKASDIAPCGVNCIACSARFNPKTPCPGCRAPENTITRKSCRTCTKKVCAFDKGLTWCFECEEFPCTGIRKLSDRYAKNYQIDLVRNGLEAKENMDEFIESQIERFTCRYCGGIIDQHHRRCSLCASDAIL